MGELRQILIVWMFIALPTAWFALLEVKRVWAIDRVTVVNFVPLVVASFLVGARWPITALERAAKYLARIDQ